MMSVVEVKMEEVGVISEPELPSCAGGGGGEDEDFHLIKLQPLSYYLIDQTAGFRREENLKKPFKGFSDVEEEELYSKIDVRCDYLLEKVAKLSEKLKEEVISATKSKNGVIILSDENPVASFIWKRLVTTPPETQPLQLGQDKERKDGAQLIKLPTETPTEMDKWQDDDELKSWKPVSVDSSSRCGRVILSPKKNSSGDLPVIQEPPKPLDVQWKPKKPEGFVMGMLPPKYPKRIENSSKDSASDVQMDVDNDFTPSGDEEAGGSTAVKAIPDDSLFQISAIHQSGAIDVNELVPFLKPEPPQPPKRRKIEEVRSKQVCSILCEGRGGKIPTLQCFKCRCMMHGACVGAPDLISTPYFICPTCYESDRNQKKQQAQNSSLPKPIIPPPKRTAPTFLSPPPTPGKGMHFPSSRTYTNRNPTMMNEPKKRKQPMEPLIQKPFTIRSRAPLNILSPSKPSWPIPTPQLGAHGGSGRGLSMPPLQLKPPSRPVKIAPQPRSDAIEFGNVTLSLVPPPSPGLGSPSPFNIPKGPPLIAKKLSARTFVPPSADSVTITLVSKQQESNSRGSYVAAPQGLKLLSMCAPTPRPRLSQNKPRQQWAVTITQVEEPRPRPGGMRGSEQEHYFVP